MVCCINVNITQNWGFTVKTNNEVHLFCLMSIYNIYIQIHVFAQASQGTFWEVLAGWQHDEMRGNMQL